MSANYDQSLPTDKDWVRFLTGDRDMADPQLQDAEIEALLREEPNKYLAAARAGEMIIANGAAGDVVSKSVGDLSITYGEGSAEETYRAHIQRVRERGARDLLKLSGSSVFRML